MVKNGVKKLVLLFALSIVFVLSIIGVGIRDGSKADGGSNVDSKPNIIVIYTDDMNFEGLGSFGGNVLTPHMDRLAREGVRFNRYYASAPVCTPSRYGLLTGRYSSRAEVLQEKYETDEPAFIRWNTHIMSGERTIAHILGEHGYRTGMVGKYHNIPNEDMQEDCTRLGGADDPRVKECMKENYAMLKDSIKSRSGLGEVASLYPNNLHALGIPEKLQHHNMEWVTQGALDFIEGNKDNPFFLYLPTTIPHVPSPVKSMKADPRITPKGMLDTVPDVQPSRKSVFERVSDAGLSEEKAVYTWLDDAIGAVHQKLKDLNIADNTLIILASDHSAAHDGRGKMTLYEGGIRTPAFMWWPGEIPSGEERDGLAANIDVAPTILEAADVEVPEDYTMDGTSMLPLVREGKDVRSSVYLEVTYSRGVVTDNWKYIALRYPEETMDEIPDDGPNPFNHEGKKYIVDALAGSLRVRYRAHELYPGYFDLDQLYNLNADPGEQDNLAGRPKYKPRLDSMKQLLNTYLRQFPHDFGELDDESRQSESLNR